MGRKGKCRATRAQENRERMREKRQASVEAVATMGLAPLPEEKPLARTMASPSLTSEKNCPASMGMAPRDEEKPLARTMASPSFASEKNYPTAKSFLSSSQGSLSIPHEDMAPTSDSPLWVCTPPRVPSPRLEHQGVAGQAKLVEVTSIIKSNNKKMCQMSSNILEQLNANIQLNDKSENIHEPKTMPDTAECIIDKELYTCHQLESCPTSEKSTTNAASSNCGDKEVCGILPYSFSEQYIARGSFHQGSLRFGLNAGKQCVANCLVALVQSKLSTVSRWDFVMLDTILTQGNDLYTWIHGNNDLLLVSDLPLKIEVNNMLVNIDMKESYAALINMDENIDIPSALPLDQAIQESLIETDGCFICVQGSTSLVIKQENRLFLFDSHARNDFCLPESNGTSIVMSLQSVDHLYHHLVTFVKNNSQVQFEITGVVLHIAHVQVNATAVNNNDGPFDRLQNQYSNQSDESFCLPEPAKCNQNDLETVPTCDSFVSGKENTSSTDTEVSKSNEPDVQFVSSMLNAKFDFKPTDAPLRRKLCSNLKIPLKYISKSGNYKPVMSMGNPESTKSIVGDGNCLFRALSFAVSQRQEFYSIMRETIVNHSLQNADRLSAFVDSISVEEHVMTNKMLENNSWGTAIEILAAADLMRTDIYTFSEGKWLRYSAKQIEKDVVINEKAIYLKLQNNHYEVVTSVMEDLNIDETTKRNVNKVKMTKSNLKEVLTNENFESIGLTPPKKQKKDIEKEKYQSTPEIRDRKLKSAKERYATDAAFRDDVKSRYQSNKESFKRKLVDKYANDSEYSEEKKRRCKAMYDTDKVYRNDKMHASITKYATDKTFQQNVKDASITKYATDKTFQQNVKDASTTKYATDKTFQQNVKDASTTKYATDKTFQQNVKVASITKYATDKTFQQNVKNASITKYATDITFQQNVKNASITKYATDITFQQNVKNASITKYATDITFQQNVKDAGINKYATDETYRTNLKDVGINKYATDETYSKNLKDASINKYATDEAHRKNVKDASSKKYLVDEEHRNKIARQTNERREAEKDKLRKIENVIQKFKLESKNGPEFVCGCCFRLFFRKQVIECDDKTYEKKGPEVANLSKICISNKYVHECNGDCETACKYANSSRTSLWVCFTCHRKLLVGTVPAESFANNLELEDVPAELNSLNSLEQHLVALNIPFMKILGLPKGGQKGVHGPVVCVPSNIHQLTSTLPRSEDSNRMLAVKLKRKIEYKGYQEYQYISTKRVETALNYLKQNNVWYSDVQLAESWLNPIPKEDNSNEQNSNQNLEKTDVVNPNVNEEKTDSDKLVEKDLNNNDHESTDEESYLDDKLRGVQLNTCLQPADIGQEMLDQCFDEVFNISPAAGNKPVSVLQEEGIEAKSFPTHFPSGINTFKEEREERLSLHRYFNMRLLCVDNRFAKDTSYIFFAQYLSELDQVMSNVQISLRKQSPIAPDGKKVTSSMLLNKECLRDLIKKDEAIKYLKPIRGTPPYWQATQKDMFAMIRQLAKPTFFCSFSSADFRWSEMLETVMKQQGDTRNIEDLDWNEKCKILYSNPVTLARMFDHRFQTFLKEVILSDASPIGKVVDYFYRIEFQQRGSPHAHCLFWIEGAPIFGKDSNADVVNFINKYITCKIPDKAVDFELNEMVTSLHQHSKNHSKSCKKKGTTCRFNFPRPPSNETFIAEVLDTTEEIENQAKQKINQLWECILDKENDGLSVDQMFNKVGMTQEDFENICAVVAKRNTVILKRNTDEIYINQYNEHLLRAWNANMDIQYVLDEYSCVVYIISYISKAERELGLLLQQTKNEAAEGNLNAQQTMKKVGTAYLHHREISAQEAVYRVTGLNLKGCSRKVEFVPLGSNPSRMSVPLKEIERARNAAKIRNNDETDDEAMWMTNIVDRYKARPNDAMFEDMCLAEFSSDYSVLVKSQVPQKINEETTFKLLKNLGYIRKRTRTNPAVIRYPRFCMETAPEKYYQSMLQLFLPYRVDQQLKPAQFETFEQFLLNGSVKLSNSKQITDVQSIVESNKAKYIKIDQSLDRAEKDLEMRGYEEDAWAQLCPETEAARLECNIEGTISTVEDEVSDETIPDLNQPNTVGGSNFLTTILYPKNEIIPLLQNLNSKQRKIFYKIRDWCLQKANGETVDPFYVFVTGGGGTGKSHLIKCLYYEMTRILSRTLEHPDDVCVLLTAPTGTAAFNISGMTIHSALGIYKNLSIDHALLSEDKINTLRSKLESLQVIIIDEISMVNKRLLFFIHQRLRQIKKMPEDSLFGGVSVIAVGDFYQLPPVKTKKSDKLYIKDPSNPMNLLWNELFEIVELDEIMRQRNDSLFAEILNRIRVRTKNNRIEQNDLSVLKSRIREGPNSALHIFATNDEVKAHNNEMVMKLGSEVKLLEAEDYQKIKESGQLVRKASHFPEKDLQLSSSLLLGVGARVMLIKNIDTKDGLVNGVIGTVMEIVQNALNKLPQIIYVNFDNENVGKIATVQKTISGKRCIGIEPSTEDVPKCNGSRKQYPLQLAWGCTVHKVQGLTVKECVIDLNKCFSCGQAYVALSRVTSLDGLYIKDIDEKVLKAKIYCDPDVEKGLLNMKKFVDEDEESPDINCITFLYHNIEGLINHIEDLRKNPIVRNVDFICLTETWLQKEMSCNLDEFTFEHISRSDAFNDNSELHTSLKQMHHGGVGVFFKEVFLFENVELQYQNLECFVFKVMSLDVVIVTIYRTQKQPIHDFMDNYRHLIDRLVLSTDKLIVLGDFNQNILKDDTVVLHYMESIGFRQLVTRPTTEGGTLVDHVYFRGIRPLEISVLPTYYSYHEAILVKIKS